LVDDDARVHRHRAGVVDDDRVDVHLAQLRQLAHHLRHAQQHLLQRLHVGRRAPRHSPSVSTRAALDQPARQELVQRRQLHRAVGDQLDHRAAGAEGDHRAEGLVGDQADVDLAAAPRPRHVLDRDAVDARLRAAPAHRSSMSL
jgi:hypothetical protein